MNNLILTTSAGQIQVGNELDFYKSLTHNVVNTRTVSVPVISNIDRGVKPVDTLFESQPYNYGGDLITEKRFELKDVTHEVSRRDLYDLNAPVNHNDLHSFLQRYADHKLQDKITKMISDDFKIMVAKKQPTFFTKDLTLDNIQDLAMEHIKNYSTSGLIAFPYNISKYQKFFVLANPEAFALYKTETQIMARVEMATHEAIALARFCEIRPEKWCIGRYENLEYLKELQDYSQFSTESNEDLTTD